MRSQIQRIVEEMEVPPHCRTQFSTREDEQLQAQVQRRAGMSPGSWGETGKRQRAEEDSFRGSTAHSFLNVAL